jgi:hypothetical protein
MLKIPTYVDDILVTNSFILQNRVIGTRYLAAVWRKI